MLLVTCLSPQHVTLSSRERLLSDQTDTRVLPLDTRKELLLTEPLGNPVRDVRLEEAMEAWARKWPVWGKAGNSDGR